MEGIKKYLVIFAVVIIGILPIFFGLNIQYLFINNLNPSRLLLFLLGVITLFLLGRIIILILFDDKLIDQMKNHDLIQAFINQNNKSVIWFTFPLTMLMEELIFRFYVIIVLLDILHFNELLVILLSSIIFAFYHLHFWFMFKNFRLFISYFILSFGLGLFNSFVFLYFGLIICFFVHFGVAFEMYYHLYNKYFKKNNGKT